MLKPVVDIIRVESGFPDGTFGVLLLQREVLCVTLEPPNLANERDISCIPSGQFLCKRKVSPHFGTTYIVLDVPDRGDILFHGGNWTSDTGGCILLAEKYGLLKGKRAIVNSSLAFTLFMDTLQPYPEFHLTIKEAWG